MKDEQEGKRAKNMKEAKKQISSAQRLHDLEQKTMHMQQSMQEQLEVLKQVISRLTAIQNNGKNLAAGVDSVNQKINAMVSLLESDSKVTNERLLDKITQLKVESLEKQTAALKEQGLLEEMTDGLDDSSYVVLEERTPSGELFSPRTQLLVASLTEELRGKLAGSKKGDTVSLGENKNSVTILETYRVVNNESQDQVQQ